MVTRHGRGRYTLWQMTKALAGALAIVGLFAIVAAEVSNRRGVMAGCALAVTIFYAAVLTAAEATEPITGRHRAQEGGRHRLRAPVRESENA